MSVYKLCDECVHYKSDGKGLGDCQVHACKVPPSKMNNETPGFAHCQEWTLQKSKEYKEQSND